MFIEMLFFIMTNTVDGTTFSSYISS